MSDTKFKRGQIVKHRLNGMKMIVISQDTTGGEKVYCKWFKEKDQYWLEESFYSEELEIVTEKND